MTINKEALEIIKVDENKFEKLHHLFDKATKDIFALRQKTKPKNAAEHAALFSNAKADKVFSTHALAFIGLYENLLNHNFQNATKDADFIKPKLAEFKEVIKQIDHADTNEDHHEEHHKDFEEVLDVIEEVEKAFKL